MVNNYAKTACREIRKRKLHSGLNVFGLALGLACSFLIALFLRDELSYDRFHAKANNIYRLTTEVLYQGNDPEWSASAMFAVGPALHASIPDIESSTRFFGSFLNSTLVQRGDARFYEDAVFFVDPEVFEIFSYDLVQGDPATVLTRPNTLVLSNSVARKYFGDEDPMGNTLTMGDKTYEVTGVMADLPSNTHLHVEILASLATYSSQPSYLEHGWRLLGFYTYLLLSENADPNVVAASINAYTEQKAAAEILGFRLQPLTDIHLRSQLGGEIETNSDIRYVYIFGTIALIMLLIASINYMNLATASAARRAKEVGVRKVVGARRGQLVQQFLMESVMTSGLAFVLCLVLVELSLPLFNQLTQKALVVDYGSDGLILFGLAMALGLLAGSYPALFLTRYRPVHVLKGGFLKPQSHRAPLRELLVVFQFTVTLTLIICTLFVQRQLDFVREERLGFDKEQLVVLHSGAQLGEQYQAFKNALLQHSAIDRVTTTTNIPGQLIFNEYGMKAGDESDQERFFLTYSNVDIDFLETLRLELIEGRNFSPSLSSDADQSILINESTARKMGWEEPIGQQLFSKDVVGVVRDYLTASSREEVKPASFTLTNAAERFVIARIRPGYMDLGLDHLKEVWGRFVPSSPFNFSLVDADIDGLYRSDQRLGSIFGTFTLLAVVIACLGLFGLATFAAAQRTKEVGIRKVFGASVSGIISLLSTDFVKLVVLAFLIAAPIAYFIMDSWLEDFAYRITLSAGLFLLAGGVTLSIAVLTVSYQAIRAALANPVRSLRYE